jgi:hypothetical protein
MREIGIQFSCPYLYHLLTLRVNSSKSKIPIELTDCHRRGNTSHYLRMLSNVTEDIEHDSRTIQRNDDIALIIKIISKSSHRRILSIVHVNIYRLISPQF